MPYSSEFLSEVKNHVKGKLSELGAFADEELPDYITVMVANKKKRSSMIKDLQLFLGPQTEQFTDWLHDLLDSKTQLKSSKKDAPVEKSNIKPGKGQKKEKSRRSLHRSGSSCKRRSDRSRSPIPSRNLSSTEPTAADIVSVQADENEFTDENSLPVHAEVKCATESKPTEQRRVVSTSSLGSKSQKPPDDLPAVRSVVKVSSTNPTKAQLNTNTTASAAVGGMLLKRAMNEARASTAQSQERPAAIVRGQKRSIEKSEAIVKPQEKKVESDDLEEMEVPTKMTRFVVTMGEEPLPLKPSVKSRLGPRVMASVANTSDNVELFDAREILIAKKSQVQLPRMQIILGDSFGEDEEDGEGVESGINDPFNVEDENDGKSEDRKPDRSNIPSSLQRCRYWPNCRNQENCQYIHPKEECKAFPSCRFGDRCLYIHPPCRYGSQCSRPGCAFSHTGLGDTKISPLTPKILCRYFPHCKLPPGTCPFYHPPTPVCRFGAACLNRATTCPFAHPVPSVKAKASSATVPSSKLKWVAPGKSVTGAVSATAKKQKLSVSSEILNPATAATPSILAQPASTEISS